MARLYTTGFEINTVTAGVDWLTLTNTAPTNQTGTVHTAGGRALEWNLTAAQGAVTQRVYSANGARIGYCRVYVRFASFPAASLKLIAFQDSTPAACGFIGITSGGALQLLNSNGPQIGSNSTPLSLNTWYRVELKNDATSGTGVLEGRIDGAVFAAGANNIQGSWDRVKIGSTGANDTWDLFFDDWAINDDTGGNQNSYPGPANVYTIQANAAGDAQGFTTQVGGSAGSHYTSVNENPPDDATSYVASLILNQSELYNFADPGLSGTITVVHVQARHANLVAADATASFKTQIEKAGSGTVAQSAAVIPNSTTWVTGNATTALRCTPLQTLYLDPDGGAWTGATIDSLQAGVIVAAANTRAIAISTVWVVVEMAPVAINSTDTGSGVDANTGVRPGTQTETAAGAEGTVGIALPLQLDTATNSSTEVTAMPSSDTGTAADADGGLVQIGTGETGVGADLLVTITHPDTDSGAGLDAERSPRLAGSDTGKGTESSGTVVHPDVDTGAGVDMSGGPAVGGAEAGAGVDLTVSWNASVSDADFGLAQDGPPGGGGAGGYADLAYGGGSYALGGLAVGGYLIIIRPASQETASGLESTPLAVVPDSDTAGAVEAVLRLAVGAGDTGAALEGVGPLRLHVDPDSAAAIELAAAAAHLVGSDAGSDAEAERLAVLGADSGSGLEAVRQLVLGALEAAVGQDKEFVIVVGVGVVEGVAQVRVVVRSAGSAAAVIRGAGKP